MSLGIVKTWELKTQIIAVVQLSEQIANKKLAVSGPIGVTDG